MKNKKQKAKSAILRAEQGMALILVTFISLILLLAILSLVERVAKSDKSSLKIDKSNQAFYLAESGIQQALEQLRLNPYITDDPQLATQTSGDITEGNKVIGNYAIDLRKVIQTNPERWVLVVSTGTVTSPDANTAPLATKVIKAVIGTSNPGDYFAVISGTLNIAGGSNFSGKVYADVINFNLNNGKPINVKSATFVTSSNYNSLTAAEQALITIDNTPNTPPQQGKFIAPLEMNDPKLQDYLTKAQTDLNNGGGNSVITDPNYFMGKSEINPPDNGTHLYYYDGVQDLKIPSDLKINGTVAFVSRGSIRLMGNVVYDSTDNTPQDAAGFFSNANVIVDANSPDNTTINGQIIVPNGSFTAESGSIAKATIGKFTFKGSSVEKESSTFKGIFAQRDYSYDPYLQTNPFGSFNLLPSYMAYIVSWN